MARLNPYLNFNGNAEEAFNFYRSALGGEFQAMMRFGDVPSEGHTAPEDAKKLMHVALDLGNGDFILGCDVPSTYPAPTTGDNFHISINARSRAEADRIFEALSKGGKASMPMADMFWGSYFGMLSDKYGVQWMVGYDENSQG